ncbi:MAG TPA: hypothetical protein VNB23_00125 [Ramlibacter sp.]|nr:hypothetical protein [Ramlibacter sp.]
MDAPFGLELMLLALAWAATLMVRPWRLLQPVQGKVPLATPALGLAVVISWLWAWPGLAALPMPLHWSGAPLAALLVGWPLAIPILTFAGLSTMASTGASFPDALGLIVWSGVVPATLVLGLGHVVRRAFGPNPVAYMLGRAFFVPMVALGGCGLLAATLAHAFSGPTGDLQRIAIGLLAMGEAAWTCAIVSLLVAYKPQWLATWSDRMYFGRPARARMRSQPPR